MNLLDVMEDAESSDTNKGCFFHYCQALGNHFQKCGLDNSEWRRKENANEKFNFSFKSMVFLRDELLDALLQELKTKYFAKVHPESQQENLIFVLPLF